MSNMTEFYASILENVREEAKKEERERIIEALEAQRVRLGTTFIKDIIEVIGLNK
jgi:hypothetical protein